MLRKLLVISTLVSLFLISAHFVGAVAPKGSLKHPEHVFNVYQHLHDGCVQVRTRSTGALASSGSGTGWIIHGKDGTTFVWTAGHVVANLLTESGTLEGTVRVQTKAFENFDDVGDLFYDAEILRFSFCKDDTLEDLCLLKVMKSRLKKSLTFLPDDKKYPKLGDRLILTGCTGALNDGLFISEGTLGRRGVKRGKFQFDYTNMSALPGCSGGPIATGRGYVVGMIIGGRGESHCHYTPSRRIRAWAKKMDVEYALNPKLNVPRKDKLGFKMETPPKKKEILELGKKILIIP